MRRFPPNFPRRLVFAKTEKDRVPEQSIVRPVHIGGDDISLAAQTAERRSRPASVRSIVDFFFKFIDAR
jgi:hypothetical protein